MDLMLESGEGLLLATAVGRATLSETVELGKNICNAAAERGFSKILLDCLAVVGELSVTERYILGKTIVDYCASRSMTPKVAIIGNPPAVTGLGAKVAWNRGMVVQAFSERQSAMDWLMGFGSTASAM